MTLALGSSFRLKSATSDFGRPRASSCNDTPYESEITTAPLKLKNPLTRSPSWRPGSACATELAMTEHAGHSGRHHRGDESGQGSHAWNMPSGTGMYDGVSGRQSRTS